MKTQIVYNYFAREAITSWEDKNRPTPWPVDEHGKMPWEYVLRNPTKELESLKIGDIVTITHGGKSFDYILTKTTDADHHNWVDVNDTRYHDLQDPRDYGKGVRDVTKLFKASAFGG